MAIFVFVEVPVNEPCRFPEVIPLLVFEAHPLGLGIPHDFLTQWYWLPFQALAAAYRQGHVAEFVKKKKRFSFFSLLKICVDR